MRVIEQFGYGGAEMLRPAEREIPEPGAGEVVVRVAAAGLDAGLVHLLAGHPRPVRWAMPLRGTRVLGTDVAGIVHAVGSGVSGPGMTGVAVGDAVFGVAADGALAEFARVSVTKLAPKPEALSFVEAAAVPTSATTALRAVRDSARVAPGGRVLVLGAGGGAGHFAVQLARAAGAHVTGASSTAKTGLVAGLGADVVIDYTAEDPLAAGPFDAIIDTGGHRTLRSLRKALTRTGVLVIVGSEPEGDPWGGLGRSMRAAALSPFGRQRLVMLASSEDRQALLDLSAFIAAGELRPAIAAVHPLEETAEAVGRLGRGRGTGKTVIAVATPRATEAEAPVARGDAAEEPAG